MKKNLSSALLIVIFCFFFSGCAIQSESQIIKYTIYIGLNDKDTYTQLVSYEEAEKKVSDIALKYVDGFTARAGKGAYKDEKGVITHENNLVIEFNNATEQQMKAIMDEILQVLNQNSILIEKQKVNSEFYEGAKP
jgi:hypothetical protein